jgi:thioredoxin reductase (NADPH)
MNKIYDLIIIGIGSAGLSASIYASRYKLDHLIFGVERGGQMNEIYEIENWPGDISISGKDLVNRMTNHVENYGVSIQHESVISVKKTENNFFKLETSKNTYQSKCLILAMGAKYRRMNIPGEKEFLGKGVSYCATCDAMFFRDKTVAVAGGGNSAAVVALELADFAKYIYLIYKEEKNSAEPLLLDKIKSIEKIEIISGTDILEIKGNAKVEKIILDKVYNGKTYLGLDGVFIEVGTEPGVELARKLGVETDEQDYIKVKEDMSTNIPGIFAAGDITTGSNKFRQVLVAAAEGAIAANGVYKILKLK